jgi:hypothetical protein
LRIEAKSHVRQLQVGQRVWIDHRTNPRNSRITTVARVVSGALVTWNGPRTQDRAPVGKEYGWHCEVVDGALRWTRPPLDGSCDAGEFWARFLDPDHPLPPGVPLVGPDLNPAAK